MTKASNLSRAMQQHLQSLRAAGMTVLPSGKGQEFSLSFESDLSENSPEQPALVRESPQALTSTKSQPTPAEEIGVVTATSTVDRAQPPASSAGQWEPSDKDQATELQVLKSEMEGCTRCSELAEGRRNIVFGVGNPQARLVLLGEAPGEREDRMGEPFVGAAGQLLDKILAACGLNRNDDVYIVNTIKCRPPQNRNPKPEEVGNCWGFAQAQLEIIQPEFICCLGSVAARTLLQTTDSVGRLRKRFHSYRGSKVMVTYHPAYLLRTTSAKKHAWDDMQMLMREMGITIPDGR